MAACSPNLETIIAMNSRLGGAPAGKVGRAPRASADLIANGWLSWVPPDGSSGRVLVAAPLRRSQSRSSALENSVMKAA